VSVTKSLELVRKGDALVLRKVPEAVGAFEVEVRAGEDVGLPAIGAILSLSERRHDRRTPDQVIELPKGGEPRFVVRNRREGDRFQPLGMARDKKLKDFFIDRKIARDVRDSIPLLLWNDQIVWVGGIAISDAFQVTDPAGGELYDVWMERAGASVEAEGQAQIHGEADRQTRRHPR
jgi:tRNA(Ile)-lysidine synthase